MKSVLASASIEIKFNHWPLDSSEEVYKPKFPSNISQLSWSKDNNYLTFISDKSQSEVICAKENHVRHVIPLTFIPEVSALVFQRTDKRSLCVGTKNGHVVMFDTRSKKTLKIYSPLPSMVNQLDFSVGDEHLAIACQNGNLIVHKMHESKASGCYNLPTSITAMRFHPTEARSLGVATEDGAVVLWDVKSEKRHYFAQTHTSKISDLAMTLNYLITIGYDNKFCIHDLHINECIFRSNLHQPLTAVDIHNDGNTIALGSSDGTLYIYDIRKYLEPLKKWKAHNTKINSLRFENKKTDEYNEEMSISGASLPIDADAICKIPTLKANKPADYAQTDSLGNEDKDDSIKNADMTMKPVTLKTIKKEVFDIIQKGAKDINNQLEGQFKVLTSFFTNEFTNINTKVEEHWDIISVVANVSKEDVKQK